MAEQPDTVNVRVLSQLPDPHSSIAFGPLPATLTIAELKQKIRTILPTQPPPERQRLIYRGHPLTRDTDTLLSVFAPDAVQQSEVHTLHLVVREPAPPDGQAQSLGSVPSTATGTAPPGPPTVPVTILQLPTTTVLPQTPFDTNPQPGTINLNVTTSMQHELQTLQQLSLQMQQSQLRLASLRANVMQGQGPGGLNQSSVHVTPLPGAALGAVGPFPIPNPFVPNPSQGGQQQLQQHGNNNPFVLHQRNMPGIHPPQFPNHPNVMFSQAILPPQPNQNNVPFPIQATAAGRLTARPSSAPSHPLQRSTSSNPNSSSGQGVPNLNQTATQPQSVLAIQADDPQQAMLNTMDAMYQSMGVGAEERQRLREQMGRNLAVPQQGTSMETSGANINTLEVVNDTSTSTVRENESESQRSVNAVETSQRSTTGQNQQQNVNRTTANGNGNRHGIPNGQRWTMTINASNMPFQPQPGIPPTFHVPQQMFLPTPQLRNAPQPGHIVTSFGGNIPTQQTSHLRYIGAQHAIESMQHYSGVLRSIVEDHRDGAAVAGGNGSVPNMPTSGSAAERQHRIQAIVLARNQHQALVNDVLSHGPPSGYTGPNAEQVATLQAMNDQFAQLAQQAQIPTRTSPGPAVTLETGRSVPDVPATETSTRRSDPSSDVVAYLVSSPYGPRAVVYTPQGRFSSTQRTTSTRRARATARIVGDSRRTGTPTSSSGNAIPQPAPGAVPDVGDAALPAQPLQQLVVRQQLPAQPQQAQAQPQDDNLVVALTPYFRTAWFFTRLCAFFWLFGGFGGSNTQRMIATIVMSLCYHAYQAGVFRAQQEWLQRHWEGLIGRPEDQRDAADRAGANAAAQAPPGPGEVRPEDAARRLVEERRQRDRGWLRERARAVERAVALFIASLYPGIGERHVAERERMVREAVERDRAAAAAAAAAAVAPPPPAAAPAPEVSTTQGQDSNTERPETEGKDIVAGEGHVGTDAVAEGTSSSVAVREDGEGQLTQRRREGEE